METDGAWWLVRSGQFGWWEARLCWLDNEPSGTSTCYVGRSCRGVTDHVRLLQDHQRDESQRRRRRGERRKRGEEEERREEEQMTDECVRARDRCNITNTHRQQSRFTEREWRTAEILISNIECRSLKAALCSDTETHFLYWISPWLYSRAAGPLVNSRLIMWGLQGWLIFIWVLLVLTWLGNLLSLMVLTGAEIWHILRLILILVLDLGFNWNLIRICQPWFDACWSWLRTCWPWVLLWDLLALISSWLVGPDRSSFGTCWPWSGALDLLVFATWSWPGTWCLDCLWCVASCVVLNEV